MKVKRFNENTENEPYYKELGYDMCMLDHLAASYQVWTDAEGLEPMSADELIFEELSDEQRNYVDAFLKIWDLTEDFEHKYSAPNFVPKKISNKYNL